MLSETIREDFPILQTKYKSGQPMIYLDSAATALHPQPVIDQMVNVMSRWSANVHRSVNFLGDEATALYEGARTKVADFIGAESHEIVFVRNTTEAINLVAKGWKKKGRVLVSSLEHHANLLPWLGTDWVPPLDSGSLDSERVLFEIGKGDVSVVAVSHVGNVTGACAPIRDIADKCHKHDTVLLVDGAQSAPHFSINVRELDCDFLAFSGHKLGGPTGIGALYGKLDRLSELNPLLHGGAMVEEVHSSRIKLMAPPWKFEAGTPPIEAAVGFGAATEYLDSLGMELVAHHEETLTRMALDRLGDVPGIRIVGTTDRKCGPISIALGGIPPEVVARTLSDSNGICVRSGFHCAQPLHDHLGFPPTLRISFFVYNQPWEIDRFVNNLREIMSFSIASF